MQGPMLTTAVGSSLLCDDFLTSHHPGAVYGQRRFLSISYGKQDEVRMKGAIFSIVPFYPGRYCCSQPGCFFLASNSIIWFLRVPASVTDLMRDYLLLSFLQGFLPLFYNYFACLASVWKLRIPLIFLAVSAVMNIVLDLLLSSLSSQALPLRLSV